MILSSSSGIVGDRRSVSFVKAEKRSLPATCSSVTRSSTLMTLNAGDEGSTWLSTIEEVGLFFQ